MGYNIPLDKMGTGEMQQMCGGVENVEDWINQLRNWAGDPRNQMPMHLKMRLQALFETARERMAAVDMISRAIDASEHGKCNDALQDMLFIFNGTEP